MAFIDTAIYRSADLSFAWTRRLLAILDSAMVLGIGMFIAAGMTFGAWKLVREQAKLPADPR